MSVLQQYLDIVGIDKNTFNKLRFVSNNNKLITGVGYIHRNDNKFTPLYPPTLVNPEKGVEDKEKYPNFNSINGKPGRLVFEYTAVKDIKLNTLVLSGFTLENNDTKMSGNTHFGTCPGNVVKLDSQLDTNGIFKGPRSSSDFDPNPTQIKLWGGSSKSIKHVQGNADKQHHEHLLKFHFIKWGKTRWYDALPFQYKLAHINQHGVGQSQGNAPGPCGSPTCVYPFGSNFDNTLPTLKGPLRYVAGQNNNYDVFVKAEFNVLYRGPKYIANVTANPKQSDASSSAFYILKGLGLNPLDGGFRGKINDYCKNNLAGETGMFNTETLTYDKFVAAVDKEYESLDGSGTGIDVKKTDQELRYKKLICSCEFPTSKNKETTRDCSNLFCKKHGTIQLSEQREKCPDICVQILNADDGAALVNVNMKCKDKGLTEEEAAEMKDNMKGTKGNPASKQGDDTKKPSNDNIFSGIGKAFGIDDDGEDDDGDEEGLSTGGIVGIAVGFFFLLFFGFLFWWLIKQ